MVQGIGLTRNEREYIIKNKDTKFPGQIAQELSANFALENGGYRGRQTVKQAIREIDESTD